MKFNYYLMAFLFLVATGVNAQVTNTTVDSGYLQGPIYVPSIAEQIQNGTLITERTFHETHERISRLGQVVPGKGYPKPGDVDYSVELQKNTQQTRNRAPIQTFETLTGSVPFNPSDPTGSVGPNHYVAAWNNSFRIYDKSGNPLTPEATLGTLFPGNNIGDPIVFYDDTADRFIITEFDNSPNGFNVAVCQGPDPVNDGWFIYTAGFGTGGFPDYPKFSVWADTWMVTANILGANKVFAIERNEMLTGAPSQFISLPLPGFVNPVGGFFGTQAFNTTGTLAPAGTPAPIVYLQDDSYNGVSVDHLKIWSATIDWVTPGNSSMSAPQQINTAPFLSVFDGGSFSNLSQPGGGPALDALQALVANRAQYRRFAGYNSAIFNFVVDTDPGAGEIAGIRWYEVRQSSDGQPWTIFQEGTYTSPDGKHAWNGSMIMNSAGDIAMGYTAMSSTNTADRVSSRYTGRYATDPLNVMTVAEDLIGQGSNNGNSNRYADYSQISLDPVDESFWFVNEYFNPNMRNVVGQFILAPPLADDIGVTSIDAPNSGVLTATEDITVTINNFGSNDITNPAVQYTIDGGTPVVENYSGTINAGTSASFTFAATADLSSPATYTIAAKTNLAGDTNTGNDETTKMVTSGVLFCMPQALLGCNIDGIKMFVLGTINTDDGGIGCNTEPASSPQGYADRTALSTDLDNQAGTNVYNLQAQMNWTAGLNIEALSVWIDFDDSGTFEVSERLISGEFFTVANALQTFTLTIPVGSALGTHRLRAKAMDTSAGGNVLDPCTDFDYGEVQDYTVNITGVLGFEDLAISQAELIVVSSDNNQFEISLVTSFDDIASISIYNMLGQKLAFNNLVKQGDRYIYHLDMSYAAAGIYLIKMGDQVSNTYKTAKIIVK